MRPFGGGALRHQRLQAILAIAAIGASVALPVVLVSVGGGVASHELSDLENSGYQVVVSAPGLHGVEYAHNLSDRIDALPSIAAAAPILSVAIDAFNATGARAPVLAEGVVPGTFLPTLGPSERGLFPDPLRLGDPSDSVHYDNGTYAGTATNDVLVSSPYATRYDVHVNGTIDLSPSTNTSEEVPYLVKGIFGVPFSFIQPQGADAVLLPLSDLQSLTGLASGPGTVIPDAADTIEVVVGGTAATNPAAVAEVVSEVQHLAGPQYSVGSLSQQELELASANAVLTGFYLALSSVGLVVGWLFLAVVLLRRVEIDRRSIGIRRAIGLPGRSVVLGIARDGVVLAATGAVAGVLGGYVLVAALARWGSSTVQEAARLAIFGPVLLAEIVLGLVGLSLLASLIASRAALRLDLAEALR
jgi:ABC-type lipoprotein release transport system permease subunit